MANRTAHGDGSMHRTIVGDEVPRLRHPLGVKGIPNYLHLHRDGLKNLRMGVALLGDQRTVVALDGLALAVTDTMEREDGTLPECHQQPLHGG